MMPGSAAARTRILFGSAITLHWQVAVVRVPARCADDAVSGYSKLFSSTRKISVEFAGILPCAREP